jgi:hypothetical protein
VNLARLNELATEAGISELDPSEETPRIPTGASGEFLANRGVGDWAEVTLKGILDGAGYHAVAYGEDNRLSADDEGFREMYLKNRAELRSIGKRPDLLVFSSDVADRLELGSSISGLTLAEQDPIVRQALAGVEVRGSKFRGKVYRAFREAQADEGEDVSHIESITPKVEDLPLILKWVRTFEIPHLYCQVFMDQIFGLTFEDLLRILVVRSKTTGRALRRTESFEGFSARDLRDVRVTSPVKSNFKKTHFIPVTLGKQLAEIGDWNSGRPTFKWLERMTRFGRLDAYGVPEGGRFAVNAQAVRDLISAATG